MLPRFQCGFHRAHDTSASSVSVSVWLQYKGVLSRHDVRGGPDSHSNSATAIQPQPVIAGNWHRHRPTCMTGRHVADSLPSHTSEEGHSLLQRRDSIADLIVRVSNHTTSMMSEASSKQHLAFQSEEGQWHGGGSRAVAVVARGWQGHCGATATTKRTSLALNDSSFLM